MNQNYKQRKSGPNPTVERYALLAVAHYNVGHYKRAETSASKAVALEPAYARVWMILGRARMMLGRCEQALENLRRASALDSSIGDTWVSLYVCYEMLGRREDASRLALNLKQLARGHKAVPKILARELRLREKEP